MKKISVVFGLALILLMGTVPSQTANAVAACTPTGFFRDSINMTAALINPGNVSGEVDATGCNIGVYYDAGTNQVENANIHGANYFGIVVNGDVNTVSVDVLNSQVHHIGETPFNGAQHGVAVYYRGFNSGGSTSGTVRGNEIHHYQKGGIVVNGNSNVSVLWNTVTGEGPVNYIAENGIQFGFGAHGSAVANTVTGHSYTGANFASSGGILVVGGPCYGLPAYTVDVLVVNNTLVGNDVGVFVSNLDASCAAPSVPTNIKVIGNDISNDAVNNTTGNGAVGYQAGVSDVGNGDKIMGNRISGAGYNDCSPDYCVAIDADVSFTNNPKAHGNSISP